MSSLRTAAKQALLILESGLLVSHSAQVVKDLRAALAEPVQEPVECEPQEAVTEDGWCEWVCPKPRGYLMQCCDCGLIHEVESRVAKYRPRPSEEFEVVDDPDLQVQWRMNRRDDISPQRPAEPVEPVEHLLDKQAALAQLPPCLLTIQHPLTVVAAVVVLQLQTLTLAVAPLEHSGRQLLAAQQALAAAAALAVQTTQVMLAALVAYTVLVVALGAQQKQPVLAHKALLFSRTTWRRHLMLPLLKPQPQQT
jgi:hypothetical protein